MAILSGIAQDTHTNLQLDAGVILVGLTEQKIKQGSIDWNDLGALGCVGATKGGATFAAIPQIRNLLDDINGARGAYKEGAIIDSWDITLKATLSELALANLQTALGMPIAQGTAHGNDFTKTTPKVGMVDAGAYGANVSWVGTIGNKQQPIIILLKNTLNTNGLTIVTEDKGTGSVEIELKAHYDLLKPEDVPFSIFYPKK